LNRSDRRKTEHVKNISKTTKSLEKKDAGGNNALENVKKRITGNAEVGSYKTKCLQTIVIQNKRSKLTDIDLIDQFSMKKLANGLITANNTNLQYANRIMVQSTIITVIMIDHSGHD